MRLSRRLYFFMAINNLNKIVLRIADVVCGKDSADTHRLINKVLNHSNGESLQLFKINVDVAVREKCRPTFVFQIHRNSGIVTGYSYKLCDRLVKEQIWATVNSKLHADVEFIVKRQTILSAQSVSLLAVQYSEPSSSEKSRIVLILIGF